MHSSKQEVDLSGAPTRLRTMLPMCAAATLALLLFAQLRYGASTEVSGQAPLGLLEPHTASEDNLISAAGRLAGAHAWLCLVIVVGLSGLWPHVKLLTTVGVVALLDCGTITKKRAIDTLHVLEVLGKYSFADVFMICCNFVTFNITTGGAYRVALLFKLEVNLWMELHWAAVALIVAVTFSAFLTQWSIREISAASQATGTNDQIDCEEAPLVSDADKRQCPPAAESVLRAVPALLGVIFLVVGSALSLVTVERDGFLGNIIRPQDSKDLNLSVFAISQAMWGGPQDRGGNVCAKILVVFFIVLVFLVPLLELLCLAAHAMSVQRKRVLLAAEWLHSFDCVDVLLLVTVAFVFELHTVVGFNIGSECDPFKDVMTNKALLRLAGLGFAASSSCFDPIPRFSWGWPVMLMAVIARMFAWRSTVRLRP